MTDTPVLRTGRDRLRYTIAFEALLVAMLIPAGAVYFDKPLASVGVLGAILSLKAMAIGLLYNWVFDRIEARKGRIASERPHLLRILHAVGFEAFLTLTSLPIYMLLLDITVFEALAADIVVTAFVVGYAYVFTLAYDRMFPLARPARARGQAAALRSHPAR